MVRAIEIPRPAGETVDTSADLPRERLTGVSKAAVFVLALEESLASGLLQGLGDEDLESLTGEIARLGVVGHEVLGGVLEEFRELARVHSALKEGGVGAAVRLLERSFPRERAGRLIDLLEAQERRHPLAFLSAAETESLLAFLEREHPQTVAVVLAHMPPAKAAEILDRFDESARGDLIRRIASLESTDPEAIERIEASLREHLMDGSSSPVELEGPGLERAAGILREAGRGRRQVLESLRAAQPDLADAIRRRLFAFEELEWIEEAGLKRILREVDPASLVIAMKTAAGPLQERILRALPPRAEAAIREQLELLGPVSPADAESARKTVAETVLRLQEKGAVDLKARPLESRRWKS